jgi:hypothetical protein
VASHGKILRVKVAEPEKRARRATNQQKAKSSPYAGGVSNHWLTFGYINARYDVIFSLRK